jgi:hypothetical protein
MKPLDDMLPVEREEPYQELIRLLQQADQPAVTIPPSRQVQIIERVQERLLKTGAEIPLNQAMPGPLTGVMNSSPGTVVSQAASPRRRGRLIHLSTLLAAALVIGAIVGTSLLISMSRPQTTGTPSIGPVVTPVTIHTQAGGLEASMQLTPGPYFLGELLAADLSVTNHTHTTFLLMRTFYGNPCKGDLGIMMTGGDSLHYTAPSGLDYHISITHLNSCDPMGIMQTQLEPGHTITIHQYLVITSSGHVTLSAGGTFFTIVGHDNAGHSGNFIVPTAGPLDGHWPLLRIDVASQVPPDRMLSLKRQGEQVSVTAPLDARSHLVYESVLHCQYGNGSFSFSGPFYWTSLSTTVLHKVPCSVDNANGMNFPGTFVDWTYAVSAPGYAIAWGRDPS